MGAPRLAFVGQIAPDVDLRGAGAHEQTLAALGRLADTLAERGLGLDDLLRLRLFVADLDELAAIEGTLQTRLGSERPAISVVELPTEREERESSGGPKAGQKAAVTLDAVAAPGARERRRLAPGSARLGPWVFLGALATAEPRALFARMAELLREQGAELRDVVRLGSWLTFPMRDYGPFGAVRRELVVSAGLLPVSAGVQVGRVGLAEERLACEAIVYAPEERGAYEPLVPAERPTVFAGQPPVFTERAPTSIAPPAHATSRLADFYVDARAAGGHVFTSGEVPDGRGSIAEQAREVYERLRAHLAAHGAAPADVVQQTVFVRATPNDDADVEGRATDGAFADHTATDDAVTSHTAVTEAARDFYGPTLPPTTLLAVADLGFRPGCAVEIELVAAVDASPPNAR